MVDRKTFGDDQWLYIIVSVFENRGLPLDCFHKDMKTDELLAVIDAHLDHPTFDHRYLIERAWNREHAYLEGIEGGVADTIDSWLETGQSRMHHLEYAKQYVFGKDIAGKESYALGFVVNLVREGFVDQVRSAYIAGQLEFLTKQQYDSLMSQKRTQQL